MLIPGAGIQNVYSPIVVGGKVAGNMGVAGTAGASAGSPFKSMFEDALQNVAALDEVKSADSYNLAIGDMDDLAAMMTNSERAQTAFQLMGQMRNKVLDSYSEIMRLNV